MKFHGISAELISADDYFQEIASRNLLENKQPPIIINRLAKGEYFPESGLDIIDKVSLLLQNQIKDDNLNDAPRCGVLCSRPISGRFNLGKKCPSCGYSVAERGLDPDVWIETPVEEGWFISPRFWMLFNSVVGGMVYEKFDRTKSIHRDRGDDLMLWMIDPRYKPSSTRSDSKIHTVIDILSEIGYVRDVTSLHDNFTRIMLHIAEEQNWNRLFKIPASNRDGLVERDLDRARFIKIVTEYKHAIFSKKLPMLPTKMLASELSDGKLKMDPVFQALHDVAKGIAELYYFTKRPTVAKAKMRLSKVNKLMAYFYSDYCKEMMEQKTGEYRGKLSRTYVAFSGRVTISPQSGIHDPLKLKAPWRWFVNLMKVDISAKLKRRGYSRRQAKRIIQYASMQHDPLVAEILRELIKESPGGLGILVLPLRNPTLIQLAVQALWIDDFTEDVNQCSLLISVLVIKMPNGDFDGDQLMVWRPVGQEEYELAQHLRTDNGFMSAETPDVVAHGMIIHNEVISIQNRFLRETAEDEIVGVSLTGL